MTERSSGFSTVSILFTASTAGTPEFFIWRMSSASCLPTEAMGSTTSTTASTSATLSRTTLSIYSPRRVRARWKPGVSMNTNCVSPLAVTPVMRPRVVCGLLDTMATFSPTRALVSVLLPTFGRPAIVIMAFLVIMLLLFQAASASFYRNSLPLNRWPWQSRQARRSPSWRCSFFRRTAPRRRRAAAWG